MSGISSCTVYQATLRGAHNENYGLITATWAPDNSILVSSSADSTMAIWKYRHSYKCPFVDTFLIFCKLLWYPFQLILIPFFTVT
jgi:WD40 repeat protein